MTHGDKAKAKGKASAPKSSSKAGENGKGAQQAGAKESKAGESGGKKQQAVSEKAAAATKGRAPAKEPATGKGDPKGKGRNAPVPEPGGFNNPVIGNAFKLAVKKYPNALRKLTD